MLEDLDTKLANKGLMVPLDLGAKGRLANPVLFGCDVLGHRISDFVVLCVAVRLVAMPLPMLVG